MEVFITDLDARLTKDQLQHSLTPILSQIKVNVFDVRKRNDRTFARLTVTDTVKAQQLLQLAAGNPILLPSPSGRYARFTVSRYSPDSQLLKVLHKEEKDWAGRQKSGKLPKEPNNRSDKPSGLDLSVLECGRWETATGKTCFVPYYSSHGPGSLTTQGRALLVKLDACKGKRYDLVIDRANIQSASLSKIGGKRALTITLALSPKIYEDRPPEAADAIAEALYDLSLGPSVKRSPTRFRDQNLPGSSPAVPGTCLTYQLTFSEEVTNFRMRMQSMIRNRIPISRMRETPIHSQVSEHTQQIKVLAAELDEHKCSFPWSFQVQALWANALLSPREVQRLLPSMDAIRLRSGEAVLTKALRRLTWQLAIPDATTNATTEGMKGAYRALLQQERFLLQEDEQQEPSRDEVCVHRATVTPTGLYLSGPEKVAANRILRQYRKHQDCFLRVIFVDETEDKIEFDRNASNDRIFRGRFLAILHGGLEIAGQHFDFLGFSHSSLRSQACWFMRPFVHEGTLLFAKHLISQLGDFSAIRCPAKCAARIGQAFSESTSAIPMDPNIVQILNDVEVGQYTFTDGCGTMSKDVWRSLRGNHSSKTQPTSYQIRYKGVKGMLTLDTRLRQSQIRFRESMVKFTGSPSNDIEICGTNARPLPFKLNRPMIKILEDLDVPASTFETLQDEAVQNLRLSARSPDSAIDFIKHHLSDSSSGLPRLLRCLQTIRIDVTEDSFLRDILGALLQVELREIKYRSRILVPSAVTLYGISDETNTLKEKQVYVIYTGEDFKNVYHSGTVAVTRSPAMHPGDIQIVRAVVPPNDSSIRDLHNCVVFSQQGERDLPSMLSGGDLDGDLYNIIYDKDLLPRKIASPAEYPPAKPVDIGRTVTSEDMTRFFIDFMENDQLGRIASLHQVFADDKGTFSQECLLLAELHSTAVDFSKSGVPVDVKRIPKTPPYRPDFMAPSASTKVEKGVKRPTELTEPDGDQRYRYYESDRVLGKLYRAIDEDIFFDSLGDDVSSIFSRDAADTVLGEVLNWVKDQMDGTDLEEYFDLATEVRDYYESNMLEFMSRYATRRTDRLTEKEVFIGTILGRSGAASRRQREQSEEMKSRFNFELRDIKSWMEKKTEDYEYGFLCLAAACLAHAVERKSNVDGKLNSFGWFAAAMCVPQLFEQ